MTKSSFEYPPHESFGFLIRDLHRAINKDLAKKIAPSNLTTAQWFFLRSLWEKDGISQRELSRSVGLTEPTTVAALKVMQRNGLIQRDRDKLDTLKVIVKLTRKGRSFKGKLLPYVREINERMLEDFSQKEIDKLMKTLRALILRMEEITTNS
jgi:DNA-binding MarR family transcriptional regulator